MKVFLSKYKWKLLLAFAIFIVAIPLGINSLFKLTSPLNIFIAEWGAGDALAFYGVMLASATTIIGVYISIEYAQRNYRIDEANRVKPYLALTHYKSHSKANLFSNLAPGQTEKSIGEQDQGTSEYEEYRLERVYIIIDQATIEFRDRLSDAQQQRLKSGGFEWCNQGGGCYTLHARTYSPIWTVRPSGAMQSVFWKAITFSNTKNRGWIFFAISTDSITRLLRLISRSFFL